MVAVFGLRTLLIDLLACQLALVAHEASHDAREEVGTARVTGVARGVLGGALVEALLFAVVTGLVSVAGSCREVKETSVSLVWPCYFEAIIWCSLFLKGEGTGRSVGRCSCNEQNQGEGNLLLSS